MKKTKTKQGKTYIQKLRKRRNTVLANTKTNTRKTARNKHWDKRGKQYLETSRNNKKKKEKVHGNTTTKLIRKKCP